LDQKPQRGSEQDFIPPPAGDRKSRWGLRGKTVWDWLDLLIVPLMLALITVGFAWYQAARQNHIEDRRARAERDLVAQRAQDEALQAYLDQMSTLILEKDLRNSKEGSAVRTLAVARTRTVLAAMDPSRKRQVMMFLSEAELLYPYGVEGGTIIQLNSADLSGANLAGILLPSANLANANLKGTNLSRADLGEAYLSDANLRGTDLSGAYLKNANLSDANGWTEEQLSEAKSLEGATMPDGQTLKGFETPNGPTFEEWLKSKGSGEDKEND
jgi:hypothetical protein